MAPEHRYRRKRPEAFQTAKHSVRRVVNGLSPVTKLMTDSEKRPFSDGH
jgi:hypothetical protein